MYYDVHGDPISLDDWGRLFEDMAYRRIEETELAFSNGHVWISTVWMGLDHSFGNGPPLIFETMPFGGRLDQMAFRWTTLGEARVGHHKVVEGIRLDYRLPRIERMLNA